MTDEDMIQTSAAELLMRSIDKQKQPFLTNAKRQELTYDCNQYAEDVVMESPKETTSPKEMDSIDVANHITKNILMNELDGAIWLTKVQNKVGPFAKN